MNLEKLSDSELINGILEHREKEKEETLSLLYHLGELDRRKLYREMGYSSLFDYCQRGLRYSEGSSYRRVAAARALIESPELAPLFIRGEVTLCTIALASKSLKEKETIVSEIVGKSKREVQELLAPEARVKREVIKPIILKREATPLLPEPKREELYSLSFSLSKETYKRYERVRDILSLKLGRRLSLEDVIGELISRELKRGRPKKIKKLSRYIPLSIRKEVRERDSHRCTFTSDTGVRCSETRYLHFDHVVPYAMGGASIPSNLRLLCAAHNQLHAKRCFGESFISTATGGGK